jgi:ADP-ribose pyrophosphatase YjhB (NUDIX family)
MSITVVKHDIQKYILSYLTYHRVARFKDLIPPKTTTNLFTYHLKLLQKRDLITWVDDGYTLTTLALAYIDRLNDEGEFAYQQPKMVTMFVIQNGDGGILLQKRTKQPYIDTWTLPNGKLSIDDESLADAAKREVIEKIGLLNPQLRQAGNCYIRVVENDAPITVTFAHIFTFVSDDIVLKDDMIWIHPRKLDTVPLAPAVEQIVARTFFRDPLYFEEFIHDVQQSEG